MFTPTCSTHRQDRAGDRRGLRSRPHPRTWPGGARRTVLSAARSGDALAETFSTLDLNTWHSNPTEEARALWEKLADQTPVGRNSLPHDYVTAVVLLAAEGSAFVDGTNLVDGGGSIW